MLRKSIAICLTTIIILATRTQADPTPTKIPIAVTPFQVLAPEGNDWIGRALQEGLATGLQKTPRLSSTIIAGLPPTDSSSAITLAKSANPAYIIFGSIQIVDSQLRVTAQIISTSTGQSIASLKSDGPERDLFNLEDQLTDRCQKILVPPQKSPSKSSTAAPTIELTGPTISSGASRYFDGNLAFQITPPERFRDDYDRYYNQSYDTSGCPYYYGYYGCGFPSYGCGGGWFGGLVYPVAAPISGW